jgi:hypothetical protein
MTNTLAQVIPNTPAALNIATALICAGIGGAAAALINLIGGFVMRHLESKRQIREIAIKVAFESWRHHNEIKTELIKSGARGDALGILPPQSYVAHTLRVVGIAANTRISADEAAERIYRMHDTYKDESAN